MCAVLEQSGLRCWMAPRDMPTGDWGVAIIDAINNCRVMVLILSSHSNMSKHVKREVERAVDKDKPIIPFRVENVPIAKSLEYFISSLQLSDAFTPPLENHLRGLAVTVRGLLSGGSSEALSAPKLPPSLVTSRLSKRQLVFGGIALGVLAAILLPCVLLAMWLRAGWQEAEATRQRVVKQSQHISADVAKALGNDSADRPSSEAKPLAKKSSSSLPPSISDSTKSLRDSMDSISRSVNNTSRTNVDMKGSKVTALDFVELEKFQYLRRLDLTGAEIDNASLARLPDSVEELHLEQSNFNDVGVKALAELRNLRKLFLDRTKITDEGLAAMRHVGHLSLIGTDITDQGLRQLLKRDSPAFLFLDDTAITGEGFRSNQRCTFYELSLKNTQLNDEGLKCLSESSVQKLDLRGTKITDAGLVHLHRQESLDHLLLDGEAISPQAIQALKSARKNLKIEF